MAESSVRERTGPGAAGRRARDVTPREPGREEPRADSPKGFRAVVKRSVLGALTIVVSVNLWTGGPLLALWIGSKIQSAVGQLSMAAVGATVAVLIVETFLLYKALAYLNSRYNAVIGRTVPRQQAAWLKPMSGERRSLEVRRPLSATERIVVASVVVALLALETWFFFFAHYKLPG